jgi:predicted ester cyclase
VPHGSHGYRPRGTGRHPATGKSVEFDCTHIIRVENGKVAEHWGTTDNLKLMQQIGAVAA